MTQNKTSRGEVGMRLFHKKKTNYHFFIIIIMIIIIILIIIIGCGRIYCNIFCFCSELSAITLHILKTDTQVNNVFLHFSLNQLRLKKGRYSASIVSIITRKREDELVEYHTSRTGQVIGG